MKEFGIPGQIPVLNIPTDYPRPAIQSFAGDAVSFEVSAEHTAALKALAQQENVTLYMLLLTGFYVFLSKLSGMEDIVIGTAVAGRKQAALHNIMGVLIKTLPLRNYPYHDKTFKDFLAGVKERTLTALENQESTGIGDSACRANRRHRAPPPLEVVPPFEMSHALAHARNWESLRFRAARFERLHRAHRPRQQSTATSATRVPLRNFDPGSRRVHGRDLCESLRAPVLRIPRPGPDPARRREAGRIPLRLR